MGQHIYGTGFVELISLPIVPVTFGPLGTFETSGTFMTFGTFKTFGTFEGWIFADVFCMESRNGIKWFNEMEMSWFPYWNKFVKI